MDVAVIQNGANHVFLEAEVAVAEPLAVALAAVAEVAVAHHLVPDIVIQKHITKADNAIAQLALATIL